MYGAVSGHPLAPAKAVSCPYNHQVGIKVSGVRKRRLPFFDPFVHGKTFYLGSNAVPRKMAKNLSSCFTYIEAMLAFEIANKDLDYLRTAKQRQRLVHRTRRFGVAIPHDQYPLPHTGEGASVRNREDGPADTAKNVNEVFLGQLILAPLVIRLSNNA